ncbi:glutamine synthetase family protein [Rhodococcus sp. ACPA1]|uniref:glutamine synthetase family protein n=1 Tax=Rhodococcus sp. ACPA1 TaxID=2028572 RepID=UPI0015C9A6A6|nr:glutamine synthetase family protein [Rhodococcus sp. ACPA1]
MPTTREHMTPLELALSDPARDSELKRCRQLFDEGGVTHVHCQYVSVQGRVLGKVMPVKYFLETAGRKGVPFGYAVAGGLQASLAGELLGPGGISTREGLLVPDLATAQILPWDPSVARVFCDHFRSLREEVGPGEPEEADARGNLKRVIAAFREETGLELRTGCEPEMSWFSGPDAIDRSASFFPDWVGPSYHLEHIAEMMPILKRITQYAQEMGFEMIQSDYEDPGQLECNFLYDNALATADRLITYRQICMAVAKEFGVLATFMPKPVPGIMANGCHHHASLWRGDENVFADDDDLTDLGRHALGGLLEHTRGMTAVLASTTNSYARFWDVGLFAPAVTNWGYDNRTTSYRVLPGRVEVRSPDAAVNPYLSHAALLGAMADGIRRNLDPGKPELGNAYAPSDEETPSTFAAPPLTLSEALDALEEDKAVRSVLPGSLYDTFTACKRDECNRRSGAITDWDFNTYLRYTP